MDMDAAAEIALQNRKFAKTCVEKKRRDRINKCLDELKDLMAQSDDKARYQKMEKAEILEMAVAYMRNIRINNPHASFFSTTNTNSNSCSSNSSSSNDLLNLNTNAQTSNTTNELLTQQIYAKCLSDIQNFVCIHPGIHDEVKAGLVSHLTQRFANLSSSSSENVIDEDEHENVMSLKVKRTKKSSNAAKFSPVKKAKKHHNSDNSSLNSSSSSSTSSSSFLTNLPYSYHNNNSLRGISPALSDDADVHQHNSPILSQCSSPISQSSSSSCSSIKSSEFRYVNEQSTAAAAQEAAFKFANFELYQSAAFLKMWRPW
jgi:hypothetical protein